MRQRRPDAHRAHPPGSSRAFTLIELLIVMFIVSLLSVMVTVAFSQLTKTSRVDQALQVVLSALKQARASAINLRRVVAVYYGDDFGRIDPKPVAGVLPERSRIEIWAVLDRGYNDAPFEPDENPAYQPWYPFRFPDRMLTPQPLTLPDGVRVVAGSYDSPWGVGPRFSFPNYHKEARGEIIRHHTVFASNGTLPSWYAGCYAAVIIFDEATGDHIVLKTNDSWTPYKRPQVMTRALKWLGPTQLTPANKKDIGKLIDQYPGSI